MNAWPMAESEFSSSLHAAGDVLLNKLVSLQELGRENEVIVYSFGTRGADLARQLRNAGVKCFIYDNAKTALAMAAAEGFAICSNTALDRPLIVAAGQHQNSILGSLNRPAWSLAEGLYAFDLRNQYGKARLFSDGLAEHSAALYEVYRWIDADCRTEFLNVLLFRASLDVTRIADSRIPIGRMWVPPSAVGEIRSFCDVGAYEGETLVAMKAAFPALTKTFAIEPNPDLITKIENAAAHLGLSNRSYAGAAWGRSSRLMVQTNPNGMMSISEDAKGNVPADALDQLAPGEVFDYVKFDVESAEAEALHGASSMLRGARCVAVASYHLPEDLVDIPKQMEGIVSAKENRAWRLAYHHYSECFDDSIFYFYRA
jgi:FkbM family methyltransferase